MLTRTSYCDTWLRPTHTLTPHLGLVKWDQNHIWAWSLGPSHGHGEYDFAYGLVSGTMGISHWDYRCASVKMRHAWDSARSTFHMRVKEVKAGIAAAGCDCHSKRSQGLDHSQLGYRPLTFVPSLGLDVAVEGPEYGLSRTYCGALRAELGNWSCRLARWRETWYVPWEHTCDSHRKTFGTDSKVKRQSLRFCSRIGVTSSLKSDCPVVEGVAGEASVVIPVSL